MYLIVSGSSSIRVSLVELGVAVGSGLSAVVGVAGFGKCFMSSLSASGSVVLLGAALVLGSYMVGCTKLLYLIHAE